ncbi:MAG: SEC-C metal-binding domain-containing protein, partial [Pseudomonadales bacterium]|nr:SEC-C metal-binding domain-containing protein [Pseudomonadales bacterium]
MTHDIFEPHDQAPSSPDDLFLLFQGAASYLAKSSDAPSFLDWIARIGPVLAPHIASGIAGPPGQAFRALGVSIYNAMPLPDHDFRRAPLPRPGRNEPCYCGSGEKFKHCCQPLGRLPDLKDYNMLRHILDNLPRKALAELPRTKVDVVALADTARQWRHEGEVKLAAQLLEPWFAGAGKLSGRLGFLFDELMDSYLELDQAGKRKRLLDRVITNGDRELRAAALQRKATVLTDQGDTRGAWEVFQQAQRENPGDPALAILELTLLVSQGDIDKAKQRAKFWLARVKRDRHINPEMIELLRAAAEDPVAMFADMARSSDPDLDWLATLFEEAPAVQVHYAVETSDSGGILVPDKKLAALEAAWAKVFPRCKPSLTSTGHGNPEVWNNAPDWLDFLARKPLAWHSFEVLDDLAMAVDVVPIFAIEQALLEPMLQRGAALLEANLEAAARQGKQHGELPWGFLENRCALRLLAHHAYRHLSTVDAAGGRVFMQMAERLLRLNPNDNHGIRFELSGSYLENGEDDKVVALAERFPDDLCTLTLNHILALYRLGRQGKALQVLQRAGRHHAQAIRTLLAANPKQPKLQEYAITVGGKDEAWLYRQDHLHL